MNRTPTSEAFGQDPWKARIDRVFARALVLPLLLALGLLALLLGDTLYRSVSVQVVRADMGPGHTYPFGLSAETILQKELLAQGYTLSQVAERLGLSVKTASTYKQRALNKLGLMDTPELVRWAREHGLA